MKLFGIQFGKSLPAVRTEPQAYSTPFGTIGAGNLSLPFITSNYSKNGVIYFGSDNLFPQLLNQMYYTSPIHGAIIDFVIKATLGGGYEIVGQHTGRDKVEIEVFKNRNHLNKLVKSTTRDLKMHNRVHVLLCYSESGRFLKMERIDPSAIRYRFDGNYEFSYDWSTGRDRRTYQAYHPAKVGKYTEMLFTYGEVGAGQDVYPIPTYSSALNWCYLDGEQSFLHKSNIQNSIFPSIFIRRPKRFGSKEEITKFIDGLTSNKGASGAGKIGVLTGDGFEDTPEVVQVSANNNDKLFESTSKEIKDNICFSHEINPSIMGIKVAGSLGNAQELEMSYNIFEKNVVMPMRSQVEEMFNELLQIAGINGKMVINGYKIIGEVITEGVDNTVLDKINKVSPLVANNILGSMTVNQKLALIGLPPVEGGNVAPGAQLPPQITTAV